MPNGERKDGQNQMAKNFAESNACQAFKIGSNAKAKNQVHGNA